MMMIGVLVDSNGLVKQVIPDALLCDTDYVMFVGGELRGFSPDILVFIVPDTEQINEGELLQHTPTILDAVKRSARNRISRARWVAEISGCDFHGTTIRTDRESQALLTGAALKSIQEPTYICSWKTEDGFVDLSSQEILAIADTVRHHVQTCFDKERDLFIQVNSATTIQEIQNITW